MREVLDALRTAWESAGGRFRLRGPAGPDALASWENVIGRPLPPDLRDLYAIADGEAEHVGLFFGWRWLSVGEAVEACQELRRVGGEVRPEQIIFDQHPFGAVRRVAWTPGWIPFAHDGSGTFAAVDLDPGPAGRVGQVVAIGPGRFMDFGDGVGVPYWYASSVRALLDEVLRAVRAGESTLDEYTDPPFLELDWPGPVGLGPEPAGDPGHRQELTLTVAPGADLAPLRELPRLLVLTLDGRRAGGPTEVDLGPIRGLPIESLTLTGVDIRGAHVLATLPALRLLDLGACGIETLPALPHVLRLTLDGCALGVVDGFGTTTQTVIANDLRYGAGDALIRAVAAASGIRHLDVARSGVIDIRPLHGHPALRDLDLSGNPAPDLEVLTTLSLSRLTLDFGQWRVLRPALPRLRVETPLLANAQGDEWQRLRGWLAEAGVIRRHVDGGIIEL